MKRICKNCGHDLKVAMKSLTVHYRHKYKGIGTDCFCGCDRPENKQEGIIPTVLMVMGALFMLLVMATGVSAAQMTYYSNVTIQIVGSNIFLNVSGNVYPLSNSDGNYSFMQSSLVDLPIEVIFINQTKFEIINATDNVTLICNAPNIVINNSCPTSNINVSSYSLDEINNRITTLMNAKTGEINSHITNEWVNTLKPAQDTINLCNAQLETCKGNVTETDKQLYDAKLQQEKWFFQYQDSEKNNRVLIYMSMGLFLLFLLASFFYANGGLSLKPKIKNFN